MSVDPTTADEKNPLWMPKGSVRAMLALVIVLGLLGKALLSGLSESEMALLASVAGFYFYARK